MNTQQASRPGSSTTTGSSRQGGADGPTSKPSSDKSSSESAAGLRAKAGEAVTKAADMAQQAGTQAKQTASSLAADANERAKGFLNERVSTGADFAGHVAGSARCAADNLGEKAPQLAEFVRSAAGRMEEFSEQMRDKTVDELLRNASDFTRKRPAVVFGLASLAGFLLFRVLKANPETGTGKRHTSRSGQYES